MSSKFYLPILALILVPIAHLTLSQARGADVADAPALRTELLSVAEFAEVHDKNSLPYTADPASFLKVSIPFFSAGNQINCCKISNYHYRIEDLEARLHSESALCRDRGGCLMTTYLGPWETITLGSSKKGIGSQLALEPYLESEAKLAGGNGKALYRKAFEKNGYFDPLQLAAQGRAAIDRAFAALVKDGAPSALAAEKFEREALKHPQAFPYLADLYRKAQQEQLDPAFLATLEHAQESALLLALDAIEAGADQHSGALPFVDSLVNRESILHIADLYERLRSINRWPEFRALTPEVRRARGGTFDMWVEPGIPKLRGAYNDISNTVWLDYSLPFFDNIYVLQHELWHVLWNHSDHQADQVENVIKLLSDPSASEDALRSLLLGVVTDNEFLALDQQIRLYHAMGPYTDSWDAQAADGTSQKRWHDSYEGARIYRALIPARARKAALPAPKWLSRSTLNIFQVSPWNFTTGSVFEDAYRALSLTEAYFSAQLERHRLIFEKIYLGRDAQADARLIADRVGEEYRVLNSKLQINPGPRLTCEQVERLQHALGNAWEYGLPFPYQTDDPKCAPDTNGPGHPGGGSEGTHGDFDLRGFPSLDAPYGDQP